MPINLPSVRRSLGEGGYLRSLQASNIEKSTVPTGAGDKKEYTYAEKSACSIEAMRNGEECEACQ